MHFIFSFQLREADSDRRAAGAVCIINNQRLISSLNPLGDVGPAARQSVKENLYNQCNLWFDKISCAFVCIRGSFNISSSRKQNQDN